MPIAWRRFRDPLEGPSPRRDARPTRLARLRRALFGRPLRDAESAEERVGVGSGIAVLGLDALASAAYGPEAALTVLIAAGAAGSAALTPITWGIVALLLVVHWSYRQTITAYPGGGGSFTVAKENLGVLAGALAGTALFLDYVLNVAVAIATGVGALASAAPALRPHALELCLVLLLAMTLVNLRGVREAGLVFIAPTYAFIGLLGAAIVAAIMRAPAAAAAPTVGGGTLGAWLLLRAFASGCTAMTGVEAVSNAVPIFRQPAQPRARLTLSTIIACLVLLLVGVAAACRAWGIQATPPDGDGYRSVLSQIAERGFGRGAAYYATMASVTAVACLSANTSFAGFPRLCRLLALDRFLPSVFAQQGSRLVYTQGIVLLATLGALLLIAFRGVTDRLIPLFAIGAFLAFTLSQAGMVRHWWARRGERGARRSLAINAVGASATGATLVVVAVSKFAAGAWLTLVAAPALLALFCAIRRRYRAADIVTEEPGPLSFAGIREPIVVVPIKRLDRVARKGLRFAVAIADDVRAVQVRNLDAEIEDVAPRWREDVEAPALAAGAVAPRLVTIDTEYRELRDPLLRYVRELALQNPERSIAVLIPELIERRWYHFLLHGHRATALKLMLLFRGGPEVVLISTPWYR